MAGIGVRCLDEGDAEGWTRVVRQRSLERAEQREVLDRLRVEERRRTRAEAEVSQLEAVNRATEAQRAVLPDPASNTGRARSRPTVPGRPLSRHRRRAQVPVLRRCATGSQV